MLWGEFSAYNNTQNDLDMVGALGREFSAYNNVQIDFDMVDALGREVLIQHTNRA